MQIGSVQLDKFPLFLSPMEDVSDPPFRLLCREFGADMAYSEFINVDGLLQGVANIKRKMEIAEGERPVAIQIYGKEPDKMAEAAKLVAEMNPEIIDINFGCPVKKVAMKGAGSGLLRDIPRMLAIAEAVAKAVSIPVTAKTRLGWDADSIDILNVTEQLQDVGMQAITLHGRTREQLYSGKADWNWIAKAKNNPRLKVPLIGNGDVIDGPSAKAAFETGVDALMIGRGAIGSPWVFREIKHYLQTGEELPTMTLGEQVEILKQMVLSAVTYIDEFKGILHSRRHLAATKAFKGFENFRDLRVKMLRSNTISELLSVLDEITSTFTQS